MPLPPNGIHTANVIGATYYEAASGAYMLEFIYETSEGEIKGGVCLASKAGELQAKNIERLRRVFGWPVDADPSWFSANLASLPQVDITVADGKNLRNDGTYFAEVKYFDRVGEAGGSGQTNHAPGDAKSFMAKFGAQVRALGGAAVQRPGVPPARPAPAAAPSAPPRPALPPRPQSAPVAPFTVDDAWVAYTQDIGALAGDAAACERYWNDAIRGVIGKDGDQTQMTSAQWRTVATEAAKAAKAAATPAKPSAPAVPPAADKPDDNIPF